MSEINQTENKCGLCGDFINKPEWCDNCHSSTKLTNQKCEFCNKQIDKYDTTQLDDSTDFYFVCVEHKERIICETKFVMCPDCNGSTFMKPEWGEIPDSPLKNKKRINLKFCFWHQGRKDSKICYQSFIQKWMPGKKMWIQPSLWKKSCSS